MNGLDHYQKMASQYYRQMAGRSDVEVKVSPFSVPGSGSTARANSKTNTIFLHPLFLISPDTLPTELQVSSPDDSKLQSDTYFVELEKHLTETFDIAPKELLNLEFLFKTQLKLWEQRNLLERMKCFIIAHEVGHIFHGHTRKSPNEILIYLIAFSLSFAYCKNLSLSTALVTLAVNQFMQRTLRATYQYAQQHHEKEADLKAHEVTQDLEAACAYFMVIDKIYKDAWKKLSVFQKCKKIFFTPEFIFPISHPSPQTRIAYIQHWKEV